MAASPGQRPVLLLSQEFYPARGGIGTYVEQLAGAMAGLGHDVTVLAPANPALDEFVARQSLPYRVAPLAMPATAGWLARWQVARALATLRPRLAGATLVVAEAASLRAMIYAMAPGLPWPRLAPADLRVVLHGSEVLALSRHPHRRLLFSRLLQRCSRIGVVSDYVHGLLTERYPGVAERAVRVPGAVRADVEFAPRPPGRGGPLHVLAVARVHPRKGQLALVEALAGLPLELRAQVRCTLVGPVRQPRYAEQVSTVARAAGLALDMPGAVGEGELEALYASADVFAMPSMPAGDSVEGLGLACLEASAAGIPVVAHRIGGVAEAVADGETGLLADPGDRSTLTEAFRQLLVSPALRARLGAGGPAHAATFSWRDSAARLLG